MRLPRAFLVVLCGLALVAGGSFAAIAQQRASDGAPPTGSGPRHVDRLRVIDGGSIDAYLDGKRTAIGLLGVAAPMGNTPCGKAATGALWGLVKSGVRFEDDPAQTFDARGRRMYRAVLSDGRSLTQEMTRAGLVRATALGAERAQLVQAESTARSGGVGCVWGGSAGNPSATSRLIDLLGFDSLLGARVADAAPLSAAPLPAGFIEDVVIPGGQGGLMFPTAFVFAPDGRIFVAQKSGAVRVFKNGALLPTPLIDLGSRVNDHWDHGLLGIAIGPNFATTGYVYLLYTYENDPSDYYGKKSGRLARYTVTGDTAPVASELVLLGTQAGAGCEANLMADCIPSEYFSHSVGNVKFGPDGSLFVTSGDGASFNEVDDRALRAQNIDSLAGKMLRINATNGQGVVGNPFAVPNPSDGSLRANRDKVWAYGLRNPYRFNLKPGTSTPYYGDVGWNGDEEVGVAVAGANLGWPCFEGISQQDGYRSKPVCQSLYAQGASAHRAPLYAWPHNFAGAAATGGVFYTGATYPAQYQGAYFFADYAKNFIRSFKVDSNDAIVPGTNALFAADGGTDGPVDLEMGPDSNLYYLAIDVNQLRRIRFIGGGNHPPTVVVSASPQVGAAPLAVSFSSTGTFDPDGDPLTYQWAFGDGATSNLPNPQHTYAQVGNYLPALTVDDGRSGVVTQSTTVDVGSHRPSVTINAPLPSLRYAVGEEIAFSGSATDVEDGPLPSTSLTWQLVARHCPGGVCHSHVLVNDYVGASGTLAMPDHGDENHFEFVLTAVDSAGLSNSAVVAVQPRTVQVTLNSVPAGRDLIYDGTTFTAPVVRHSVPGSAHTVEAPDQGAHVFESWSDGLPRQHELVVGPTDATYTATFNVLQAVTFDDIAGQNQNLNGQYPSGVINWGTNLWYHSAPWGAFTTKSVSFRTAAQTSATFTFLAARKLVSVRALNGGSGTTTVTISCAGQTKTQSIPAGQVVTLVTGFANGCTTVTVASTNGWDTNFDDLIHQPAAPPPPDTTAPTISAVQATSITTSSATITWTTNEAADRQVEYGLTTSYGALLPTTPGTPLGTSHSVALSGLSPNTLYHYRVKSKDAANNLATSADFTFTTQALPPADVTPPTISAVQATSITTSSATITWTTNEAADRQVEYGLTISYGSLLPATPGTPLGTSHSVALSGLSPNTLYHYRVKSKDAANNLATSADFTFTTAAGAPAQTVTFDDRTGQNQNLSGQYPTGVINWGSNQWYHSAPWGAFTTKSVSFRTSAQTSATFTFMTARRLVSVRALNGGGGTTTVTISCNGQTKTQSIAAGQVATITTGFAAVCTTVTVQSTNGWDTNFDDLVHDV